MKKILLSTGAITAVLVGASMFAAFEAHVVNVTAKIENALFVPIKELKFGTVFPQEKLDQTFNVSLSNSFQEQAQATPDLVCNGSFEIPEVTDPAKWQLFPNGYQGLCWTVEWETNVNTYQNQTRPEPALTEYHENVAAGWLAQDGDQYAEMDSDWFGPLNPLNGEPALTRLWQNISTNVGQAYTLTYYFSPRPSTAAGDNTLLVRVNGNQVASHTAAGGAGTSWTLYTYPFIATTSTTKIEFAGAGTNNSLGVFLDNIQMVGEGRVNTVSYIIRQKPKCGLPIANTDPVEYSAYGQVTEDTNGNFVCADEGYQMLPLLCPYLSKHEVTTDGDNTQNDGPGINAFHGLPGVWDLLKAKSFDDKVYGWLTATSDIADEWNIDLKVPCFTDHCAQDWPAYVAANAEPSDPPADPEAYKADPAMEHEIFGCDLWLEVNNISNGIPR